MADHASPAAAAAYADPTRFRLRSREVSRIEALSDAVFGFAITLLIVSLEVPRNYDQLSGMMRGFIPFAISFAILAWVWYTQHVFFRRYGLQDGWTITLNITLLFVVLFYVYPLKFLFGLLVESFTGNIRLVHLPDGARALGVVGAGGAVEPTIRVAQVPSLMAIYAVGFAAMFAIFVLLYVHAWRQRGRLGLNRLEMFDTVASGREAAIQMGIALGSLGLALFGGRNAVYSGWVYMLIGPTLAVHGTWAAKRRLRYAERPGVPGPPAGDGQGYPFAKPVGEDAPAAGAVVR